VAENKTQENDSDVMQFLNGIEDPTKRQDCVTLVELMGGITNAEPRMWGANIVGFGKQHYKYESGREGDWFIVGFSPRKQNLTLYLTYGFEQHSDLLEKLGKHSVGKACLYIKKLTQVDLPTLEELVRRAANGAS
jgi:hypothetical protein